MILKQNYGGEFRNLLSAIRLAMLDRRDYISFPKSKFKYTNLITSLVKEGFIESFEERGTLLVIYLKHTYSLSYESEGSVFYSIKPLARLHRKNTVSGRKYCYLKRVKGAAESFYINTDRGILTNLEVSKIFTGGFPLFLIK